MPLLIVKRVPLWVNMAHGQLLQGVFVFVDILKHQIRVLNICILEFKFHRQPFGLLLEVLCPIGRSESGEFHIMKESSIEHRMIKIGLLLVAPLFLCPAYLEAFQ